MSMSRSFLISVSSVLCCAMLSACSDVDFLSPVRKSDKLKLSGSMWYDYGNGMINLSNITRITSEASVSGVVMPREVYDNINNFYGYIGGLSPVKRALVDAHADFCFDALHSNGQNARYNYSWSAFEITASLGAFENGSQKAVLAKIIKDMQPLITPEFAANCVLKFQGSASLIFDGFKVTLEPYEEYMVFEKNEKGMVEKTVLSSKFRETAGDLSDGKTPWHGVYSSLTKG